MLNFEVDFIPNYAVAIKIKGRETVSDHYLSGLKALREEEFLKRCVTACIAELSRII